jgi:hypothetical protein
MVTVYLFTDVPLCCFPGEKADLEELQGIVDGSFYLLLKDVPFDPPVPFDLPVVLNSVFFLARL